MADVHLGYPFTGLPRSLARQRQEELKQAFVRALELAVQRDVHVVILSGDLFHQETVDRETVRFAAERLAELRGIQVFITPGQHDPLHTHSVYRVQKWATNIHIFGADWEVVSLDDLGVCVWGRGAGESPWRSPSRSVPDPEKLNLLVTAADLESLPSQGAFQPLIGRDMLRLGYDYLALGGQHEASAPLLVDGRTHALYPGSLEALNLTETGRHGCVVGQLSKQETILQFEPIGRREQFHREVDCTGALTLEDVLEQMLKVDNPVSRRQNCYRITLTGIVDPDLAVAMPIHQMRERLAGEFFWLDVEDNTNPDIDLLKLGQEKTARGLFAQALRDRLAHEQNPEAVRRLYRTLRLGLAAFEGRGPVR